METFNSQILYNNLHDSNLQTQKNPCVESLIEVISATLNSNIDSDAYNTAYIELTYELVKSQAYKLAGEDMKSEPNVAAIIQERYTAPIPSSETLLSLPKNSLGYVFASTFQQAGLKPIEVDVNLFSREKVDLDISYVEYRYRITHDIWHIVTGFDTSGSGELGLQAFYLAQFRLPSAAIALANALFSVTLLQPKNLIDLLKVIEQGWQMGKNAKPLIAQKWEEAWNKPLSQWQAELNIQPISIPH